MLMYECMNYPVGTVVFAHRRFKVDRDYMRIGEKIYTRGEWVIDAVDVDVGHIVKFDRNTTGEIILVVDWSTGERSTIHPSNVVTDYNKLYTVGAV